MAEFDDAKQNEIERFEEKLKLKAKEKGALMSLLQAAQKTYGYIPKDIIYKISEETDIPVADIYGVITFYAQFRLEPMGKNIIRICEGTACHVNNAKNILASIENELKIKVNETTKDGLFTLLSVACIGCCSLAPVIMINDETYGSLTPDKTVKILNEYKKREGVGK